MSVDPEKAAAPAPPPAACTEQDVQQLQQQLAALRSSWTWRLGRVLTKPFDVFARRRPSGDTASSSRSG